MKALHSGDLALLQYAMSAVPVKSVFVNGAPSPLSQPVLLALVQQASCALDTDAALKFDWMQECLMSIDPRHPTIADHLRKVLGPFLDRMRDFALQNTDRALTKQAAILTHVANSLLAMQ